MPIFGGKISGEGKIIRGKHILKWGIRNRNSRSVYLWERGRIPGSILEVGHFDARRTSGKYLTSCSLGEKGETFH